METSTGTGSETVTVFGFGLGFGVHGGDIWTVRVPRLRRGRLLTG